MPDHLARLRARYPDLFTNKDNNMDDHTDDDCPVCRYRDSGIAEVLPMLIEALPEESRPAAALIVVRALMNDQLLLLDGSLDERATLFLEQNRMIDALAEQYAPPEKPHLQLVDA